MTCAECGNGLKAASLDMEEAIEHDCDGEDADSDQVDDPEGDLYEIEGYDIEDTSRVQRGKIARLNKTFYGAKVTFGVKCNRCGEQFSVTGEVEEQASGFEEM